MLGRPTENSEKRHYFMQFMHNEVAESGSVFVKTIENKDDMRETAFLWRHKKDVDIKWGFVVKPITQHTKADQARYAVFRKNRTRQTATY